MNEKKTGFSSGICYIHNLAQIKLKFEVLVFDEVKNWKMQRKPLPAQSKNKNQQQTKHTTPGWGTALSVLPVLNASLLLLFHGQ